MMKKKFQITKYALRCLRCGKELTQDIHCLDCDVEHEPALLRTEYKTKQIEIKPLSQGMFRFGDWLPLNKPIRNSGYPIAYKSKRLAEKLGLGDLWISFSGYWPERGAEMHTCTFKELEAPPVLSRMGNDSRTLVVASAGNTARAFAEICSSNQIPLLLVVQESGLECLWSTRLFSDSVKLISVTGGADYYDAIRIADMIAKLPGYVPEGGARNVARRDGMGTTVLAAAVASGRIPDHYFQAVGSGTGGIAAWEAALRLAEDSRFGENRLRLHLSQNKPFTPITDAWTQGSRTLPEIDEHDARERISTISAHVLSNRRPPYSIKGGVFDALSATGGRMYSVTNQEAHEASILFEELEGIDVDPAAAVALASLMDAVTQGVLPKDEMVLLNVTGGGKSRLFKEHDIHRLLPSITIRRDEASDDYIERLFG